MSAVATFVDLLCRRSADDLALVTPLAQWRVGELAVCARSMRASRGVAGSLHTACSDDVEDFLVSLLAADGFASACLCQPRSCGAQHAWPTQRVEAGLGKVLPKPRETYWLLSTSGTTGTPKLVAHTLSSLTACTKLDLAAGAHLRWGLLYDPARFAGLQLMLQALLGGGTLIVPPDGTLTGAVEFLADQGVNALSATPTLWRKILMSSAASRLQLRQATLGGEIADAQVLHAMRHRFPEARIVHIYASTEAGVGFSVKDGQAGFPASYLQPHGQPQGVELRVGPQNQLLIKKRASAAAIWDGENCLSMDAPYFDTGDLVELRGDRVFFLGRASGAINVGGNKVMPEVVESVLMQHPAVLAAKVYATASSVVGNLVRADVSLKPQATAPDERALRAELLGACRSRLAKWEVPATIKFVGDIALGASGKVSRSWSE
jgi:acyl-CoA synthetase (AMP-forming)/AMP-acid ligase II